MLGIHDILVQIRIPGSVPLPNGFGSGSHFSYFFLITCPQALSSVLQLNFLLKLCIKILFCKHYFSPLNTFMRKGKDPDLFLWLIRLINPDPGGPKTCRSRGSGSGFPTLTVTHLNGLLKTELSNFIPVTFSDSCRGVFGSGSGSVLDPDSIRSGGQKWTAKVKKF